MPDPLQPDVRRIQNHWRMLCQTIGHRYSGTSGEQRAADYIEGQYRGFGLANTHQHRFEFPNWDFSGHSLSVGRGSKMRRITNALPMCYSASTPSGPGSSAGVTAPIVFLQTGTELDFRQPTRGKIGLLIGSLSLGDPKIKARLMGSGLAALLTVDARVPYNWRTTLGAAPQWMEGYDIPTMGVPFLEAERIVRELPAKASLHITARSFPAMSQNVIGEVVGRQNPDEVIVVSGHHDAVWGITGADDNASGVIFTLELARLFARRPARRTIRFISYGVEEKLSVGAYLYMRSLSRAEQRRCVLAFNADTIASAVGCDTAFVTGSAALERLTRRVWNEQNHPAEIARRVDPYSDHFPLNICGVPAVWLSRPSVPPDGYWYLHSVHDNLQHVSTGVMARTVRTSAAFLDLVANSPRLPFPRRIAAPIMAQVRRVAKQAYRHPWSGKRSNQLAGWIA